MYFIMAVAAAACVLAGCGKEPLPDSGGNGSGTGEPDTDNPAVEEPVYSGFQSKFYVRLENGTIVKVFKQHTTYLDDGPEIAWKDNVYISWSANDGYIVEDIDK